MRNALMLLLLVSMASADFMAERVDVVISDIQDDGSANVHESIKFVMFGNYSNSLYDSGITNSELSFWSTATGLKDLKFHTNPTVVEITDFRLRPQPRTKCNPLQGICHGELILDYVAAPARGNNASVESTARTSLFNVENYKPRTKRYTINPAALSFTTTSEGNIILDKDVYLTVKLPHDAALLDVNPRPADFAAELPARVDALSWTDMVLVKFSLVFDTEEGIDKEVSDFFGNILNGVNGALSGPHGVALVLLIAAIIGSYLYISMAKKRGEE